MKLPFFRQAVCGKTPPEAAILAKVAFGDSRKDTVRKIPTSTCLMTALLAAVFAGALAQRAAAQQQLNPPVEVPAKKDVNKKAPAPKSPAENSSVKKPDSTHTIAALVNDEAISNADIDSRFNLLMNGKVEERVRARLKAPATQEQFKEWLKKRTQGMAQPKSQEEAKGIIAGLQKEFVQNIVSSERHSIKSQASTRKEILNELIDERLKLQDAAKNTVLASDEEVKQALLNIAKNNKTDEKGFEDILHKMGVAPASFRERIKADISWKNVIRRRFGHEVQVATRDIERVIATTNDLTLGPQIELQLQKISLPLPPKAAETQRIARLGEAEKLRKQFKACSSTQTLAATVQGAKFEDLGTKQADSLVDPAKSLILKTKAGEMTPPSFNAAGQSFELYAVCAKNERTANEKRKSDAEEELRQQRFDQIAKQHLKNLRQDATIVYH